MAHLTKANIGPRQLVFWWGEEAIPGGASPQPGVTWEATTKGKRHTNVGINAGAGMKGIQGSK